MAPYEPIPVHRHPTDASPAPGGRAEPWPTGREPIRELSTCDVYIPDAPASNPSMAAPNVDPGLLGDPSRLIIWKFCVEVADEASVQVLNARLVRWLHAEPVYPLEVVWLGEFPGGVDLIAEARTETGETTVVNVDASLAADPAVALLAAALVYAGRGGDTLVLETARVFSEHLADERAEAVTGGEQ